MQPLISVIIPVYKVEPYLRRCIDSVINQTYTNLEIILVDDGSPDNSPAICDDYAQKDNRVKVIHKENGGLSSARNAGINVAIGEFLSFIDSDDWIHPNYIETLISDLLTNNADISIVENIVTSTQPKNASISNTVQILTAYEALERLFKKQEIAFIVSWGKLYKKELFKDIHFPIGRFHEDEFTTYQLFYTTKKIVWNNTPLYYYFKREDSITTARHPLDILTFFEERYKFFKQHNEQNLLSYLLVPLCWQLLCAYWYERKKKNFPDSKKYLSLFVFYVKDFNIVKSSFFHKFFLKTFAKAPWLYLLCRKTPFHLRKEF